MLRAQISTQMHKPKTWMKQQTRVENENNFCSHRIYQPLFRNLLSLWDCFYTMPWFQIKQSSLASQWVLQFKQTMKPYTYHNLIRDLPKRLTLKEPFMTKPSSFFLPKMDANKENWTKGHLIIQLKAELHFEWFKLLQQLANASEFVANKEDSKVRFAQIWCIRSLKLINCTINKLSILILRNFATKICQ